MAGPGGVEAGRLFVRVLPDTSAFARSLRRFLDRIEARTVLRLRTEADGAGLVADVRKAIAAAQAAAAVQLRTLVDTGSAVRQARTAATAASNAATVRLPVDLDTKALRAALGRVAAGATTGLKVTALAGVLAVAGAQAANLAAALAPLAGALAALPAFGVAAAGAVGVLAIAFSGVGAAIGSGLSGDLDAYRTDLAALAPAQAAFVAQVVATKPALDTLRQAVAGSVFAGLTTQVQELAAVWLPLLTTRLAGIGGAIGAGFAGIAQGARSPAFLAGVDAALAATHTAITALAAVAGPALRALGQVIGAFAPTVASAGAGLAALVGRFAAFIDAAAASGQLATFVQTVVGTLRQAGTVLLQLGGIIVAVLQAAQATGGGLLGTLGQILGTLNAFVSSVAGQTALQGFFAGVAAAVSSLAPIVVDLLGALGPGLAVLLGPQGLAGALSALAPAAKPVGAALAAIGRVAAPLLGLLGGVLADALTLAAGMVQVLAAELGPLIKVVADTGLALARALLPALSALISGGLPAAVALGQALADALAPIVPIVAELAATFLAEALPALRELQTVMAAELLPVLTDAARQIGGALVDAVRQLAPHIPNLAQAAVAFAQAGAQLVVALTPLIPVLVKLLTFVIGAHSLEFGIRALTIALHLASAGLRGSADAVQLLIGWLAAAASWAVRTGTAIRDGFAAALGFIRSLPGQIAAVFTGAATLLVDAGRRLVDGLLRGIRDMLGRAIAEARNLAKSMVNAAKSALGIFSPSAVFAELGRQTVAGFVHGLDRARPLAVAAMHSVVAAPTPVAADLASISRPEVPVVNLTALVRIGDGPVFEAIETAVRQEPERFATAVRGGDTMLNRRG